MTETISRIPVGRLAPSPTGAQHIGNARTFLIAWLHARTRGGRVLLRIEDIDSPRVKTGAQQQALEDLAWLGLDWDGEITVQTRRTALYEKALNQLITAGLVFPCTCTRSDIERAASAPHLDQEGPVYPGTCSRRSITDSNTLASHCWRFRLPEKIPSFYDGYWGQCSIDLHRSGGDFVIWKTTNTPAYQLAVVVDDADLGITEVIRGEDLIPSTPRQLLIYQALGLNPPQFAHVPLVVGLDGRRLAKRHGDTRLATLRETGVTRDLLLGLLGWSCGWLETIRPTHLSELMDRFDLNLIPREPFTLRGEHLRAIGYHSPALRT